MVWGNIFFSLACALPIIYFYFVQLVCLIFTCQAIRLFLLMVAQILKLLNGRGDRRSRRFCAQFRLIRVGGVAPVESDEFDDYEKIAKALESAREKYGVNFQGDEAKLLFDKNGKYVGFSMPINIQGTFNKSEVVSLNHFIARKSPDMHLCLVEGCKEPAMKTAENKFSNGQNLVKRNHPKVVPFSLWNTNVLSKREAVWNELNSVLKKRKSVESPSEGGSSTPGHKQMPFSFNPPPNSTSKRKSSLSDITFLLVKFICLGLFDMAITRNIVSRFILERNDFGSKRKRSSDALI